MDEKRFIELYHRQKESGLTVKEFCSNEVIAPSTFYLWQKKLRSRNRLPGFIPVVVAPSRSKSITDFLENASLPCSSQTNEVTRVEIEFPNKTILRVTSGLDFGMLRALVHLND